MADEYDNILGQMAVEQGLVTKAQFEECLAQAREASRNGNPLGLGQVLTSRGLLTGEQLVSLMKKISVTEKSSAAFVSVRREDVLFGQLLIKNKLASADQVQECLQAQEATQRTVSPERLGELLIKKGYLSFDTLKKALELQKAATPLVCSTCGGLYKLVDYQPAKRYLCRRTVEGHVCGGVLRPKSADGNGPADGQRTLALSSPGVTGDLPPEVAQIAQDPQKTFGKYVLLKELGRGGMGAVFKAYDTKLKRMVAVKFLLSETEGEEVKRFYREAQTAATLKHPNINAIYEVDQQNGKHYIAMEYIDGQTLAKSKFDPAQSLKVMSDVAMAVDYAHSKGIIHRDLKPQNIMLDSQGTPYVMDFGLAKSMKADSKLTVSGLVLGTPSYMPPEQALGWHEKIDKRSDIYSLGATLFELVCGRPPFKGNNPVDTLRLVVDQEPPRPSSLAKVSPAAETIILKCLEKDPGRRYQTARGLSDDLVLAAQGKPISARPISLMTRAARGAARHKVVLAGAAFCLLVAGTAVFAVPYLSRRSKEDTNSEPRAEAANPDRTPQKIKQLVDQGDQWMKEKKCKEAGDQYRGALALAPQDTSIKAKVDEADRLEKEQKGLTDLGERRSRIDGLIADIRKSLEEGKIPEARGQLKVAEEAAAGDEESKAKVAEAKAEIDGAEAARARERRHAMEKKVAQADQQMVDGKLVEALATYEEVKAADVSFPGIQSKIADCQKRIKDLAAAPKDSSAREKVRKKALPTFEAGLKKLDEALLELSRQNGDNAKMKTLLVEALDLFGQTVTETPAFAPANQMRGRIHAIRGDFKQAESEFSQAIQKDSQLASARVDRADLYRARALEETVLDRWQGIRESYSDVWRQKARADYEAAISTGLPETVDKALVQAALALSKKDYKGVISQMSAVIPKDGAREEAYRLRGDAYYSQIQAGMAPAQMDSLASSAWGDYEQALRLKPGHLEVLKARGSLLLFSTSALQGLTDINLAVKISPEDGMAQNMLGFYYMEKDADKALSCFDLGVKYAPWSYAGFAGRGHLRYQKKHPVQAMDDFNQAINLFPDCWPAYLGRGRIELDNKNRRGALADFKKALSLEPKKLADLQATIDNLNKKK